MKDGIDHNLKQTNHFFKKTPIRRTFRKVQKERLYFPGKKIIEVK